MQQNFVGLMQLAARAAPSADNSQPWNLRYNGDQLSIDYDVERLEGTLFPKSHPATLLALGCVIENLHQVAEVIGVRLSPTGAVSFDDHPEVLRFGITPTLPLNVANEALSALPLFQRHTNRFPFKKDRLAKVFREMPRESSAGNICVQMIESKSQIIKLAALIEHASRVRFQTREIHDWFAHSLRFSESQVQRGDGLDVATLGLPPGGRLLLKFITASWRNMAWFNRIGGYRFLATTEAASITKAGAIFAIVGAGDVDSIIDAGRQMQRLWIELNRSGYAVQPYYVITDQLQRLADGSVPPLLVPGVRQLAATVSEFFQLESGQVLNMLLRVGLPMTRPPRAKRRSVDT